MLTARASTYIHTYRTLHRRRSALQTWLGVSCKQGGIIVSPVVWRVGELLQQQQETLEFTTDNLFHAIHEGPLVSPSKFQITKTYRQVVVYSCRMQDLPGSHGTPRGDSFGRGVTVTSKGLHMIARSLSLHVASHCTLRGRPVANALHTCNQLTVSLQGAAVVAMKHQHLSLEDRSFQHLAANLKPHTLSRAQAEPRK
jgi:hypothetical protein